MKIQKESIDKNRISYMGIPGEALFLDIETTGLSPKYAFIYMIGMIYHENGSLCFESVTAESASEEEELLVRFCEVLEHTGLLIHYNGDKFDLPFIESRCRAYGMDLSLSGHAGIDLYKQARSLKDMLGLTGCKQKDIERFLGISREDRYSGKELIDVYKQYSKERDEELFKLLYQHNHDDVTGMLDILPILAYSDMFDGRFDTGDIRRNVYTAMDGSRAEELIIGFKLHSPLPTHLSINSAGIFLKAEGDSATLKIPVLNGELRFFYDDPKEYYYLPREDMAVHKSVAQYVDKEYRTQAKAYNCYTRKAGTFLPEWKPLYTPVFKKEYDSEPVYFELNDEVRFDSDLFREYILSLLKCLQHASR